MFTFTADVPTNIRNSLVPLLEAWIDRQDHPLFRLETTRYGLVSFIRTPWPIDGTPVSVGPAGEQDKASLQAFSATF